MTNATSIPSLLRYDRTVALSNPEGYNQWTGPGGMGKEVLFNYADGAQVANAIPPYGGHTDVSSAQAAQESEAANKDVIREIAIEHDQVPMGVQDVPISELKSIQLTVTASKVGSIKDNYAEVVKSAKEMPRVFIMPDGQKVLYDGNHRANAALLLGEKTIRAEVSKFEPPKPRHNSVNLTSDPVAAYSSATEMVIRKVADFPKSAAETMAISLKAGRGLGALMAHRKFEKLGLAADSTFGFDWDITPEAALRYLQDKTPIDWRKAPGLQDGLLRSKAFWITGVEQTAVLEDVLQGLIDAVAQGTTIDDFRDKFGAALQGEGVKAGQVQTIYRTNVVAAYQESQMAAYQANPLVENLTYATVGDDKVREEHAEWEGITLPKDDDWWDTHTPPCGYNCRCNLQITDPNVPLTSKDDENERKRLDIPLEKGFEYPRPDLVGRQIAEQAMAVPILTPAEAPHVALADSPFSIFSWVHETAVDGPLPTGAGKPSTPAPGFVAMPDGRVVGLSQPAIDAAPAHAREWIRGALQGPSEVWAAPYRDGRGSIVLVINALLAVKGQTLCVPIVSGTVPAHGLPVRFVTNPQEVRRGGRLL